MNVFERLTERIYRLRVPFENIYTSVFLFVTPDGTLVVDTGSDASDVRNVVVPALERESISPDVIAVTHSHGDHAGGLATLMDVYPNALCRACDTDSVPQTHRQRVEGLCDGEKVFDTIRVLVLEGHSHDSVAFYDETDKTLVSGDCVQLCGVGRYGTGIYDGIKYIASLKRLMNMDIRKLIASHQYVPLGFCADGKEAVKEYLAHSIDYALHLSEFAKKKLASGVTDFATISEIYNKQSKDLPPVSAWTFKSLVNN